jgi:hypothetical protein
MRQCEQSPKVKEKNRELGMADELVFKDEVAAEYDRAFAHVTAHFTLTRCGVSPSFVACFAPAVA